MLAFPNTRLKVLNFIRKFLDERGYAPTVRDIAKGCNISTPSVVQHHLNKLEDEGYIHRDPMVFRSIKLTEREQGIVTSVPLLGTIAAGRPIPVPTADTWATTPEETLQLTEAITQGKKDIYALKVKGNSMIDAFVDDGDIVLIQPVSTVADGEAAAVWLKSRQEVTLKKVYFEGNMVRLQPANQQMEPMYFKPAEIEIQGKIISVLRKL